MSGDILPPFPFGACGAKIFGVGMAESMASGWKEGLQRRWRHISPGVTRTPTWPTGGHPDVQGSGSVPWRWEGGQERVREGYQKCLELGLRR